MHRPTGLPWARPRHELVLLLLVGFVALTPVYVVSSQDETRLCLSRNLVHGRLTVSPCIDNAIDRAVYRGRTYTDKAPGLSVLAIPAAAATRLPGTSRWRFEGDLHLWAVRFLTSGLAFLVLAFAVGRVSEGLEPGFGAAALVTFALGTLVAPMAATSFDHDLTAAFGFGAFLLAWRGSPAWAGLAAGIAVCCEYQAAAIAAVVAVLAALRGLRALGRYAAAAAPPLAGLAAYDQQAFGSPFHASYRYVANRFTADQSSGFFGIHVPTAHGTHLVLVGDRGLLWSSPVLVAAVGGLVLVARRHGAAALACAAVAAIFVVANCGYFLPYGGISPGPRFLIPALPFLAVGLAPAFRRWLLPTAALAAASIVATTGLMLTWALASDVPYRQTIWGEIARIFTEGASSLFIQILVRDALVWVVPNRIVVAIGLAVAAAAAFALALREARPGRR